MVSQPIDGVKLAVFGADQSQRTAEGFVDLLLVAGVDGVDLLIGKVFVNAAGEVFPVHLKTFHKGSNGKTFSGTTVWVGLFKAGIIPFHDRIVSD